MTRFNQIYWMKRKICQEAQNFSLTLLFFKPKLSLNQSNMTGPLKFGLIVVNNYNSVDSMV